MSDIHFIPAEPTPIPRRGFRMTTLMIAVLVIGGSIGMVSRLIVQSAEAKSANRCVNNLKQIGLGFHNYHSVYDCFPPAYIADANGKTMHSWRVLISPFMESSSFYRSYNFSEPWDGPSNRKLITSHDPSYHHCPSRDFKPGLTSYVMIVGPKTLAPGVKSITLSDVRDGADQTIMVVEVSNVDIPWTEPRDLDAQTMSWIIDDPKKPGISSLHGQGPAVLYADGHVRRLDPALSPATLQAMTTINGGEPREPNP